MDYISTISTFNKGRNIYVNMTESYRVSPNYILCIVGVGDKVPLTIRPKSIIETIVWEGNPLYR